MRGTAMLEHSVEEHDGEEALDNRMEEGNGKGA
jgi:hypothetical protein